MLDFYKGKKVLVTGHTGFKGSWLCRILLLSGAKLSGYALEPSTDTSLFEVSGLVNDMRSIIGDIRDFKCFRKAFEEAQPEIVFHLAAQPLVRESYRAPVETYGTNVMGTVHLMECIRLSKTVHSVVNVTTDKVYLNNDSGTPFTEDMPLDGYDPYSNSKSCSELVTHSYVRSFFADSDVRVSTMRAGNVIGGGDFSKDRIIPDCIRAVSENKEIIVRNPNSVRPYQHVLEPLFAYLLVAKHQWFNASVASSYNVGPNKEDCINTKELVELFCNCWGDASWKVQTEVSAPHEAVCVTLDCAKLKDIFWSPIWSVADAVEKTVAWTKTWLRGDNIIDYMNAQIRLYESSLKASI